MEEVEKTGQRCEHKKMKLREHEKIKLWEDISSRRLYSILGKAIQWQTQRLL